MIREVNFNHHQFIQPYFIVDGLPEKEPITGLTGVYRETPDSLLRQVENDLEIGCNKMLLFGVTHKQTSSDQSSLLGQHHSNDGKELKTDLNYEFILKQIESLRSHFGDQLWIAADVCLCTYTDHGHCGFISNDGKRIKNQQTVDELSRQALLLAQAGANCVAPSDMMDGRIGSIREILDENELEDTLIMSYSAKFHSGFYGPFRIAANSAPSTTNTLKDRATYQIDPSAYKDALNCAKRDSDQGADILMVKPGLPYLDILFRLQKEITKPWAVYQVSGEYAAIELLGQNNLINSPKAHMEAWTSFFRAGASIVISYGAREARKWINML